MVGVFVAAKCCSWFPVCVEMHVSVRVYRRQGELKITLKGQEIRIFPALKFVENKDLVPNYI